jgi:hypothetical protein
MFHDFQQYSQGCGGAEALAAGEAAFRAAAAFLLRPLGFSRLVGCAGGGARASCDYAPVAWISNFTKRPPINTEQCSF